MIYQLNLQVTQVLTGAALLITHLLAFSAVPKLAESLPKFPRSRTLGILLLTIAGGWTFWLMNTMDLGEFSSKRSLLVMLVPIAYVLTIFFVEEFLAVRALGMVALLAACLLLDAAFLHDHLARIPLVALAYGWIVAGLFLVGKPYLLRDAISWLTAVPKRLSAACAGGVLYGILLIVLAVVFLKS